MAPDTLKNLTPRSDDNSRQPPGPTAKEQEVVVPVVTEEVRVNRKKIETARVRITKTIQERDVIVEEPVIYEEILIERVPINRFITEPLPVRHEGETMILPVIEEVVVTEKRLRLKEEVRISKRQVSRTQSTPVQLRHDEIQIDRIVPRHCEPTEDN